VSTSPCKVADTRNCAAVSKEIFKKGLAHDSIPRRLHAR
jgi:hypothetical protein